MTVSRKYAEDIEHPPAGHEWFLNGEVQTIQSDTIHVNGWMHLHLTRVPIYYSITPIDGPRRSKDYH